LAATFLLGVNRRNGEANERKPIRRGTPTYCSLRASEAQRRPSTPGKEERGRVHCPHCEAGTLILDSSIPDLFQSEQLPWYVATNEDSGR
jgi:hypothetical protein